ncbi:hypothetical protein EV127DRAFT_473270 [Xylaria flabelliformis]|nr:hypothetical protein EV127DRAFT_473270 [Xylaria flabelliformis]
MPRQIEPPSVAGGATSDPNALDETLQQLSGLRISNDDTQIQKQILDRAIALTGVKRDEHDAILNQPLNFSHEVLRAFGVFFNNVALLLFILRLRHTPNDLYSDLVYDKNMNDVKVWIWIWSGDYHQTKKRMEEFEYNMDYLITQANARNIYWDQVRVVWRISHMRETWSREKAWWPSQCGQHQPLAGFISRLPQSTMRLGWFQTEVNLGKPVKQWLHSDFMETWEAENPEPSQTDMNTV